VHRKEHKNSQPLKQHNIEHNLDQADNSQTEPKA